MEYTVNLIFDKTKDHILLQKKAKTEFAGLLNGPGGKVEPGESAIDCAVREVREETGLEVPASKWRWVATLSLPHDCGTGKDEVCILHFYATVINGDEFIKKDPVEPLAWFGTDNIANPRTTFPPLAGDGNLKYMIVQALKLLYREDRKC